MYRRILGRLMGGLVVLVAMVALWPAASQAAPRTFDRLYHDETVVRTFGVPSPLPHGGTDPLFVISGGVERQLNITKFAQGDREYSGGDWAVYTVTWNVAPYLLTSDEDVAAAEARGDVTVERAADQDFRCPLQP